MNPQIQQHLAKFDKEFPNSIHSELTMKGITSKWKSNEDIKSFLEQALQSTWNAAVKEVIDEMPLDYDIKTNQLIRKQLTAKFTN